MPTVPCPHCDQPVPKGTRICHHCLKDIRWSRVRAALRRSGRPPPAPPGGRERRFLWLLRIVYAMYGYTLVTGTWEAGEALALRSPGVPEWLHLLSLPALTLTLIVSGIVAVRRDPFLWTVVLAGMYSAQLFQDAASGPLELGNHVLAVILWIMAVAAPGLARRLAGKDATKFAADDRQVVGQILVLYLGILAVLLVSRVLFDDVGVLGLLLFVLTFYAGLGFVMVVALALDWPATWYATMRFRLGSGALLLTVLAVLAALGIVNWWLAFEDGRWLPAFPTRMHVGPLWLYALVALLPALSEEILCRGILWYAVRQRAGRWGTVLVTSVLFGLIHVWAGSPSGALPIQFVVGLVLGWLRLTTGSLAPCMLCHALYNAAAYSLRYDG